MNTYLLNCIPQVVTEKTPFVGNIIGVNGFGTTNAFSHVILKRNNKTKNFSKSNDINSYIPQLILVSGRNEKNTSETIQKVKLNLNILILSYIMKSIFYVINIHT